MRNVNLVDVECCARFPWSGGRHPWLDAVIETPTALIGVESKRYEPFSDTKSVSLSDAYDRDVWGNRMKPFEQVRDLLRSGAMRLPRRTCGTRRESDSAECHQAAPGRDRALWSRGGRCRGDLLGDLLTLVA
jgi:hypothetical protein